MYEYIALFKCMKSTIFIVLTLCIPLAFWGWAYEFSYFYTLGLDVYQIFDIKHYIYSSASYLVVMFVITLVLTAGIKFFSKTIDKNDWEAVKVSLNKIEFLEAVSSARWGLITTFVFWLIILLYPKVEYMSWVGANFLLLIFFNTQVFFASLYLSPSHSRFPIILAFILTIGFCFSVGGMHFANLAVGKVGQIRDDSLVTITKDKSKYIVVAKPINIPIPPSLRKILAI